jgi:nucleotide-binding universal stress UspA family protein
VRRPGILLGVGDPADVAREAAAAAAAELVEAEVASHVPTEAVFGEGGAVQVLERAAEQLDLLVMGSRGYGPLRAILLGSVSGQLDRHRTRPNRGRPAWHTPGRTGTPAPR